MKKTNIEKNQNMTNAEFVTMSSQDALWKQWFHRLVAESENLDFCNDECVLKWLEQEVKEKEEKSNEN